MESWTCQETRKKCNSGSLDPTKSRYSPFNLRSKQCSVTIRSAEHRIQGGVKFGQLKGSSSGYSDIVQTPKTNYNTDIESRVQNHKYIPLSNHSRNFLLHCQNYQTTIQHKDINPHKTRIIQYIPQHRYNICPLPNRRLNTDISTLNFSALSISSASRLLRQHAQPQTNSSELVPHSYFTSGIDTASLISSDVQTACSSDNLVSELLVLTALQPTVRRPENFSADNSRPPSPNFADYPLRVEGITINEPRVDPRFTLLAERFIHNNDTLSEKPNQLVPK